MKSKEIFYFILFLMTLSSCSFNSLFLRRKSRDFEELAKHMIDNSIKEISIESIKEESFRRRFNKVRAQGAEIGNKNSYVYELIDSVVVFKNSGSFPFIKYKCIWYDFHSTPKMVGDTLIKGYITVKIRRVRDRFYLIKKEWGDM